MIEQSFKTAFMDVHVYNEENELTAIVSSLANLIRVLKEYMGRCKNYCLAYVVNINLYQKKALALKARAKLN